MKRATVFLGILFLFLLGCATITTPNGGPKDVKAPRLIESETTPINGSVNFDGKTVQLQFDEMVKLNNPKEEIIISPSPGKDTEFIVKTDRVLITPKTGWQPNTTYSILFREGIQDVTENNVPPNLKLAFSTGPNIDSLNIKGTVKNLLKNSDAEKITVAIFEQDTFDIFTDPPVYLTKTDKSGSFSLENLKPGDYTVYAFDDKNKNLKVESRTERYGFEAKKINLTENVDSISIGLIMMDSRPLKINSIRNTGNTTRVRFNKYLKEYSIKADSDIVNNYGDSQAEINFWNPLIPGDSISQEIFATDSLDVTLDTIIYVKRTDTKPFLENLKFSLGEPVIESETGKFTTTIQFSKPIINIDFDSLNLVASFPPEASKSPSPGKKRIPTPINEQAPDSVKQIQPKDSIVNIPVTKNDIELLLQQKQILVHKEIDKNLFKGKVDPVFSFKAGKGFAISIENDTTKAVSTIVPTLWPEDTGILHVEIQTNEKNYILDLMDNSGKIIATTRNTPKSIFKNLKPTDYLLRVTLDKNGNGKWDPGNIYKRIPPEKVIYYKDAKGKTNFIMRANWEYGPLILAF